MTDLTLPVLDHGFVTLRNLAGPTRRIFLDGPRALGKAAELRAFDADDTDPANAARMSFGGQDKDRTYEVEMKLNHYLLRNKHMTPFEMIVVWLEMKLPIFVARQFVRHGTARLNEISGRYVQLPAEWYIPAMEDVVLATGDKKQGGRLVDVSNDEDYNRALRARERLDRDCARSYTSYLEAIEDGIAMEQARLHLHLNHYCCHVDTPILTQDLRWVRAGDLSEGDKLLGFEEFAKGGPGTRRRLEPSVVERYSIREDGLYRIVLSNGDEIKCNGEHKWLVCYASGSGAQWVDTVTLAREPRKWLMRKLFNTWRSGEDYKHGFLAGAFDGEGFLTYANGNGKQCGFTQRENVMLRQVRSLLHEIGVAYSEYANPDSEVVTLKINGGFSSVLEFLGTVRPPRLLENWMNNTNGGLFAKENATIESIEPCGRGDIASFQTSTGTYIAAGYPCHNTHWLWKQDLRNLFGFLVLRDHGHAQREAQKYAKVVTQLLDPHIPGLMNLYREIMRGEGKAA